jgi:hypothetical protein
MDQSGLIVRSIHQWQFFGPDLHLHLRSHHGTQAVTGGKDGLLLTQQFNLFPPMELLILDKMFNSCLEIAIGSLQRLLVLNSHF